MFLEGLVGSWRRGAPGVRALAHMRGGVATAARADQSCGSSGLIEGRAGRGGSRERAMPMRAIVDRSTNGAGCTVRSHQAIARFDAETASRRAARFLLRQRRRQPRARGRGSSIAIAVAKQQGTRSFELRAALSLAKLYQSTGRPADARAVLAPALEGFAPTPEMPEIAEAQALLAG